MRLPRMTTPRVDDRRGGRGDRARRGRAYATAVRRLSPTGLPSCDNGGDRRWSLLLVVIQKRESPHGSGPDTTESRPWPDLEGSPLMPARRLRAWLLSAFSLAITFVLALAVCFIGMVLSVGWVFGDPPTVQPGFVVTLVSMLIVGLISVGVFFVVSVAPPVRGPIRLIAAGRTILTSWSSSSDARRLRRGDFPLPRRDRLRRPVLEGVPYGTSP